MNYNNSFQGDLKLYLSSTGVKRDKIDVLANELFYKDNYIYFDEEKKLKQIDEQHLIITGLSKPGSDSIFYNGATMSFDEVVELLKESKLPRRMNIDLKHSYAGVGKGKKEITLTVDEVKSAFINGKISELWGPKEESYAYQIRISVAQPTLLFGC